MKKTKCCVAFYFVSIFLFQCLYLNAESKADLPAQASPVLQTVAHKIFGTDLSLLSVKPLSGGISGDALYLLEKKDQIVVVRIYRKGKNFQDRKLESVATQVASSLELGPKLLDYDSDYSYLVTEFAVGSPPVYATFKDKNVLKNLAESFRILHNGPPFPRKWSVFEYIRNLQPFFLKKKERLALKYLKQIERAFTLANFPSKPCHNDTHAGNIFVFNNKLSFIDWGDAGMADPYWDLALSSMYFAFDADQDKLLLEVYLGSFGALESSHFYLMKQVFLLRTAMVLGKREGEIRGNEKDFYLKMFAVNQCFFLESNPVLTYKAIADKALGLFLQHCESSYFQAQLKCILEHVSHASSASKD